MNIYFSDFFQVSPKAVEKYGAFNISLVADLPLFVDPFLLFNSRKRKYRQLHDEMIGYLRFLRDESADQHLAPGLIKAWYLFPEVKENWLGFSFTGNSGHGLGKKFAGALHQNLGKLFSTFGQETVSKGSHLEKLCLIQPGVGRDNISDFTNNLVRGFLLEYTQTFALRHIKPELRRVFSVPRVRFNYQTETWMPERFELPCFRGAYVLLTPRDILTRDDTWINRTDLVDRFLDIPQAMPNEALRAQINNYFRKVLPRKPTRKDERAAAAQTLLEFPTLVDYYIKYKEEHGDQAVSVSERKVAFSRQLYLEQFGQIAELLSRETAFYKLPGKTYDEARQRALFFKDVIENKGGHRLFYVNGQPIEREADAHILYRMTWYASPVDVTREANDGRGPVDFKVSYGSADKTLVEFKLAKNPQMESNLKRQAEIYEKASDATEPTIKVIIYFSAPEKARVEQVLKKLKLGDNPNIILVDARRDNKPSGSKAR